MKLRNWQSECIHSAISKFTDSNSTCDLKKHFLALATPGAGKTIMAATLARELYDMDLIDLVLCFSPSAIVSSDFSDALGEQFKSDFDGRIGSMGDAFTYQKLSTLDDKTWNLFDRYRVFVIFDEIHHCAGSSSENANAWGAPIIDIIKEKASYTIALTGTPWRSDSLPIALSSYCDSQKVQCDYVYGLKQAILDDVCRIPQVVAIDNDKIIITKERESNVYSSFTTLLSDRTVSYSKIVTNETVNEQILLRGVNKLDELRKYNPRAGGLVVSSSIQHAEKIQAIMALKYGKSAIIVTSNEPTPSYRIKEFRSSYDEWIISVGMVSEGTNIPRLQVCCNLTNVMTELYFRQIFGRVLRKTDAVNQDAFMFMPAAPKLICYAERMSEDIPDSIKRIKIVNMQEEIIAEADNEHLGENTVGDFSEQIKVPSEIYVDSRFADYAAHMKNSQRETNCDMQGAKTSLSEIFSGNNEKLSSYSESIEAVGIVGKYRQEQLVIKDLDPLIISDATKKRLASIAAEVN